MKTITCCYQNMPQQLFSIKFSEKEFPVMKTRAASDDKLIIPETSFHAATALVCFIMSFVRVAFILLTTLRKTVYALFALAETIVKATISGLR